MINKDRIAKMVRNARLTKPGNTSDPELSIDYFVNTEAAELADVVEELLEENERLKKEVKDLSDYIGEGINPDDDYPDIVL